MKKKINIKDVKGIEQRSLQLARKIQRQEQARKNSEKVLAMTAHIGEYLRKKKLLLQKNPKKGGKK
jgi:hypothetical protein